MKLPNTILNLILKLTFLFYTSHSWHQDSSKWDIQFILIGQETMLIYIYVLCINTHVYMCLCDVVWYVIIFMHVCTCVLHRYVNLFVWRLEVNVEVFLCHCPHYFLRLNLESPDSVVFISSMNQQDHLVSNSRDLAVLASPELELYNHSTPSILCECCEFEFWFLCLAQYALDWLCHLSRPDLYIFLIGTSHNIFINCWKSRTVEVDTNI